MQEPTFADDRRRKGRIQVQTSVECCPVPDYDVYGGRHAAQRPVPVLCQTIGRLAGVVHQEEQVVVTVWTGVPPGLRAEEIDSPRLQGGHQAVHNLYQDVIAREQVRSR
jgi:hypothetical protein